MEYKYSKNLYEKQIKYTILICGIPSILIIIKGPKLLGLAIGIMVIVADILLSLFSLYQNKFSFFVESKALKVKYKNNTIEFYWNDIDNISEDDQGLIMKFDLNKEEIQFTILNSMHNYKQFKAEIIDKANEYRISINILKEINHEG